MKERDEDDKMPFDSKERGTKRDHKEHRAERVFENRLQKKITGSHQMRNDWRRMSSRIRVGELDEELDEVLEGQV